jgi:hypothetical protein
MISRRDFLKKSSQTALAIGGALALDTLLSGCASIGFKEVRQDVINQKWEANPIIPIPKDGCYVGGHRVGLSSTVVEIYGSHIGKIPAFWDFTVGYYAAANERFPKEWSENLIDRGVIPELNYAITPFTSFEEIAKGRHDGVITRFAERAADFGKPYVFIPFKEANIRAGIFWDYGGGSAKWFKKMWRHMHEIFDKAGANTNTIWAINYLGTYSHAARKWLESFYPGDDVVDWIGFTVKNRLDYGYPYKSFRYLFFPDYAWARRNHPTKPLAVFEIGQSSNPSQHKWIRKAYEDIKEKFPAVKMVQWWEDVLRLGGMADNEHFSSRLESIEAMQEVHNDPYFIGAPLSFLGKYRKG